MSQWWLEPATSLKDHAKAVLARLNCELEVINGGDKGSLAVTKATQAKAPIYPSPVFI
ncbi:hypothetical protein [Devosia psychrophila]|nr:hypothetical protein [Devosia psychrophila]